MQHLRLTTATILFVFVGGIALLASSHMDAPLITFDDAANTTDVYAFVSERAGTQYLTTAVSVYPFEDPGIGPNKYNFDDNVRYSIHLLREPDLFEGRDTIRYDFEFRTQFNNSNTILQSYLGVVNETGDSNQNLTQTYSVTMVERNTETVLGTGVVPPNNQGIATPFYNQGNNGENPAKSGVSRPDELDRYTQSAISSLANGYEAFAGQRDDGFYADIQAVFDLLSLRGPEKRFDSQQGFNVHTIALNIPLGRIGGVNQIVGVYATTSRRSLKVLSSDPLQDPDLSGEFVQVGRQGNPLFNEGFVAIKDKDKYSRTKPGMDAELFARYALEPELASLLNALVFGGTTVAAETGRTDIAGIYIPDVIKVDLSTGPARLAGPPDDDGFSRLSIFGGDVLSSEVTGGSVPGGWPNGRRFGDDVLDIAVTAAISDLRVTPPIIRGPAGDNVDSNDIAYNKVFPYAATPLNGRTHFHDAEAKRNRQSLSHLANGGGATSTIVLQNSSTTTSVSGQVQFRDPDGNKLDLPIIPQTSQASGTSLRLRGGGGNLTDSVDFDIGPGGILTVETDGSGDVVSGTATITADGAIGSVVRFNIPGIGFTGVTTSPPLRGFTIPVRVEDGIRTGVAIQNQSAATVTIELVLVDAAGMEVAQTTLESFPALGQTARFVDEIFPDDVMEGFTGSLQVRVTGGLVGGTALELGNDPGQFTTLPVTPLN